MKWLDERCAEKITLLKSADLYRTRHEVKALNDGRIQIGGSIFKDFCGNDYLGLGRLPWAGDGPSLASASPMVSGYHSQHAALEAELADYLGFEAAIYFTSGFAANYGVIQALLDRRDQVFSDRLNHASIVDGIRASGADCVRYRHRDLDQLRCLLQKKPPRDAAGRWIISDAIFSMEGHAADLNELVKIAGEFDAALIVDDAHGFGVLGAGRGSLAAAQLSAKDLDVLILTFGKAMGCSGAIALCPSQVRDYLLQRARPYIYSTAQSPQLVAHTRVALEHLIAADTLRSHLQILSDRLIQGLQAIPALAQWQLPKPSPVWAKPRCIIPIEMGSAQAALNVSNRLKAFGFWMPAIRPPTVPAGESRIRISLSACHTIADIIELLNALEMSLAD